VAAFGRGCVQQELEFLVGQFGESLDEFAGEPLTRCNRPRLQEVALVDRRPYGLL